jgi:Coenzyme PQQ synthesis protein D (PqqD)
MWCRPRHTPARSALLPFTEGEALPSGTAVIASDGDKQPDWSRFSHLLPAQNPRVRSVRLDGETVLLDLGTGRCFRLNPVGTAVWEHCTGTATLQQIHHAVSVQLVLPPDDLHEQMVAYVVQWSHDGLLHPSDLTRR